MTNKNAYVGKTMTKNVQRIFRQIFLIFWF